MANRIASYQLLQNSRGISLHGHIKAEEIEKDFILTCLETGELIIPGVNRVLGAQVNRL